MLSFVGDTFFRNNSGVTTISEVMALLKINSLPSSPPAGGVRMTKMALFDQTLLIILVKLTTNKNVSILLNFYIVLKRKPQE